MNYFINLILLYKFNILVVTVLKKCKNMLRTHRIYCVLSEENKYLGQQGEGDYMSEGL